MEYTSQLNKNGKNCNTIFDNGRNHFTKKEKLLNRRKEKLVESKTQTLVICISHRLCT